MRRSSLAAMLSCLAVALLAAAIGDPLLEALSNAGIFGPLPLDDNHQSVIPALVGGLVLVAAFVVARGTRIVRAHRFAPRAMLRAIARSVAITSDPRILACAYALQLAAVYAMEWCEATGGGAAPHGLSWLGAPAPFALVVHLLLCVAVALVARRVARGLLAAVVTTLRSVLDLLVLAIAADRARCAAARRDDVVRRRAQSLAHRRISGRAPPRLPSFA